MRDEVPWCNRAVKSLVWCVQASVQLLSRQKRQAFWTSDTLKIEDFKALGGFELFEFSLKPVNFEIFAQVPGTRESAAALLNNLARGMKSACCDRNPECYEEERRSREHTHTHMYTRDGKQRSHETVQLNPPPAHAGICTLCISQESQLGS